MAFPTQQRFYLKNGTAAVSPTGGNKSTVLEVGTLVDGAPTTQVMGEKYALTSRTSLGVNSAGQTAHQDGYFGRFASLPLMAQDIDAGTWTIALQLKEGNANANAFLVLSVYVWRPSDDSLVGFVYDSDTPLGSEWGTGTNGTGQVITFSGGSVTTEIGDLLVAELWYHAEQATTSSYFNGTFLGGQTDVTAGYTGTDPASYLEAPSALSLLPSIQFVGATSAVGSLGSTDLTSSTAAFYQALEEDDFLVACLANGVSETGGVERTFTPPGGIWSELRNDETNYTGTTYFGMRDWTGFVTASDDGSGTWTGAVGGGSAVAALVVAGYRFVNPDTPVFDHDGAASFDSGLGSASLESPSVDALRDLSRLVAILAWGRADTGSPNGTTPDGAMTERVQANGATRWTVASLNDETVTDGATGTRTGTSAANWFYRGGQSILLNPQFNLGLFPYWGVLLSPA